MHLCMHALIVLFPAALHVLALATGSQGAGKQMGTHSQTATWKVRNISLQACVLGAAVLQVGAQRAATCAGPTMLSRIGGTPR